MARSCDGVDDSVAGDTPQLATGSIGFLFKLIAAPATNRYAVGYAELPGSTTTDKCLRITVSQTASFYVYDGAGKFTSPESGALTLGQWYHMGATFDGTTVRLYHDGVEVGTVAAGNTYTGYATPEFVMGRGVDLNNLDVYTNCAVCDAAIWTAILTADEMTSLSKRFSPLLIRPESLTRYWPIPGNNSPEPELLNASNGTVTGATKTDHPRVFMPGGLRVFGFPVSAEPPPAQSTLLRPAMVV